MKTNRIADLEKRIALEEERLRDLRAQARTEKRKADTRRKVLYGAACLAALAELSPDRRERSLKRLHEHVTRPRDREFLGLLPQVLAAEARQQEDAAPDLPFASSDGTTWFG